MTEVKAYKTSIPTLKKKRKKKITSDSEESHMQQILPAKNRYALVECIHISTYDFN